MWEAGSTGAVKTSYPCGGQMVAVRDSAGVIYLHGDHPGSISVATSSSGAVASRQQFDPWGMVRSGGVSQTSLNYTGQRRDDTGLLFYNARYYNPALGRFISADSVVPGNASGSMNGVALRPLTVDFHEPEFAAGLNQENQLGPWFTLSDDERQQVGSPWGPSNPQSLNRYSYVNNNPERWTDPTGHCLWDACVIEGIVVGAIIVEVVIPAVVGAAVIAGAVVAGQEMGRAHAAQKTTVLESRTKNPAWGNLKSFRGKTRTNGESGKNRRYYEKDYTHGDVEVYDSNGNHLGSMNPDTGEMTKPAVPGRKINV